MSVLAPVNKAAGAAAGAFIALPSAPAVWAWFETAVFKTDMPVWVDGIAIVLIGSVITFIATYFAPANVPKP